MILDLFFLSKGFIYREKRVINNAHIHQAVKNNKQNAKQTLHRNKRHTVDKQKK